MTQQTERAQIQYQFRWVRLACDTCDVPWVLAATQEDNA